MNIPEDIQTISEDDANYKRYQLFSRLKGELERRLTKARKEGRNFDSIAEAETLLRENDKFLAEEVDRRTVASGNDIINAFNGMGANFDDYTEINEGDFNFAIMFVDGLLSMKRKKRPYGLGKYNDAQLKGFKSKLEEARDVGR